MVRQIHAALLTVLTRLTGDDRWIAPLSDTVEALLGELSGKRVAIVGNARMLAELAHGEQIDSADLIIRVNRAPRPGARSHGSRTDWLALATSLGATAAREIAPKRILWMSHKRKRLPFWAVRKGRIYLHPREEMHRLRQHLGAPPSTGLMMIDLLARSDAVQIDIYGFDFFASKSLTGSRSADQVPHDFDAERQFVEALLDSDPRFVLHSMDSNQNLA